MKKLFKNISPFLMTSVLIGMTLSLSGQITKAQDSPPKPDNSARNKDQGMTAGDQPDAKSDRLLAAKVRKAIIADKDLSTYAHNVKIIVLKGTVTLKGPVKSDDEKHKVKSDAEGAATEGKVVDELTVKP